MKATQSKAPASSGLRTAAGLRAAAGLRTAAGLRAAAGLRGSSGLRAGAGLRVHWLCGLLLLVLAACTWAADAEYVIAISVDGLRGDLLASMMAQDSLGTLSNFRRFVTEGATTFNARSDFFYTVTLPNHTTMLTGRPVLQPLGQPNTVHHGYIWNVDPTATQTVHNSGNANVPYKASVFDVVHDAGMSTALYASKAKFVLFGRSWNVLYGAPDSIPPDYGRNKLDRYVNLSAGYPATAANMNATLIADLGSNPAKYSFVHYVDLDAFGHTWGWGSVQWQGAMRGIDGYLGAIFTSVTAQPSLAGHTTVILTADHGGIYNDHSDATLAADYTVPFMVWGAGVAHAADLYALNPTTRADPGTTRPDYNVTPPPIRNGDSANLALELLGLGPIPGSSLNLQQDLSLGTVTAVEPRPSSWSALKHAFR